MRNINKTRRCRRTQTLCGRQNNDIIRLNYNDGGVFSHLLLFHSPPPPRLYGPFRFEIYVIYTVENQNNSNAGSRNRHGNRFEFVVFYGYAPA